MYPFEAVSQPRKHEKIWLAVSCFRAFVAKRVGKPRIIQAGIISDVDLQAGCT